MIANNSFQLKREIKNMFHLRPHSLNPHFLWQGIILILAFQLLLQNASATAETANEINSFFIKSEDLKNQEVREIKPNETIEGKLKFGEIHSYKLKLEAGQSVIILAAQFSTSIILRGFTPEGEFQAGADITGPNRTYEPLIIVAEKAGFYRIDVSCYTPGTYAILPQSPHEITENDRKYLSALKLTNNLVETKLSQSVSVFEKGSRLLQLNEEKLRIYREIGNPKLIEIAFREIGYVYQIYLTENSTARKYNEKALETLTQINDPTEKIYVAQEKRFITGQLAAIAVDTGDYEKALTYFYQDLNSVRVDSNKEAEVDILLNIGMIYRILGDEQKALETYEQCLALNRSINPPRLDLLRTQREILVSIGNLHRGIGAGEIILDYLNERTANDGRRKAIDYYKQALELNKKIKEMDASGKPNLREPYLLLQLGNSYRELGDYSKALNYLEQSLVIYKKLDWAFGKFSVFRSLGRLYLRKGEFPKSIQYYEQALALTDKIKLSINWLNEIARDYYEGGETQKAWDLYNQAVDLSRKKALLADLAASLYEIARIERDLGNFNNARNKIEEAMQIVESIRTKISNQEIRATYFASVKRYYDFYIDLLMQAHKSQPEKGFDLLALQTSEKSRSRSLLDLLSVARIDIKQGVDSKLLERERQAQERLTDKAYQQNRLLLAKHTKEEAEKINQEIASLTNEYQATQTEIRNKSPRYAALTQPKSLDAKQIQQLLDSGTILLEYSLGDKKSYLWAVSQDSIMSFDLASRVEIEAQARRVYELLTAKNQYSKNETDEQRRVRVKAAEEEYPKAAAELSQMLFGSAMPQMGNKRLLIVPDGALNYIPFAALPLPKKESSVNSQLGINHEIITLPSASILALLRSETLNRKPAPKMLAVFADPVFNRNDIRSDSAITGRNRTNAKQSNISFKTNNKTENLALNRDFERAVSDVGLSSGNSAGLPRLPFSRREADSIFKISPKNLSLKEVDFKANKREVFSSNLEQYRMLHFATHGLLNSQHPELSGIVLSLVDESGHDIDGFLRLQDIYNLKLSADLVVLSACNTALGKDVKGEGLIGLTRGFMYAGAPRVIASLWKVDDAATAELMTIFYKKLLAENLRPAAALRAAQTEMRKQPRYKSPYYWAPFIIQGEWK